MREDLQDEVAMPADTPQLVDLLSDLFEARGLAPTQLGVRRRFIG